MEIMMKMLIILLHEQRKRIEKVEKTVVVHVVVGKIVEIIVVVLHQQALNNNDEMGSKRRGSDDMPLFKPESSENEGERDGFILLREQQVNRMKYKIPNERKEYTVEFKQRPFGIVLQFATYNKRGAIVDTLKPDLASNVYVESVILSINGQRCAKHTYKSIR